MPTNYHLKRSSEFITENANQHKDQQKKIGQKIANLPKVWIIQLITETFMISVINCQLPLLNRKYTVKRKPQYKKSECRDVASIIKLVNQGLFIPDFFEDFVQILSVSGELLGGT